jgi:transcriptional regulator of NAD metabolism
MIEATNHTIKKTPSKKRPSIEPKVHVPANDPVRREIKNAIHRVVKNLVEEALQDPETEAIAEHLANLKRDVQIQTERLENRIVNKLL